MGNVCGPWIKPPDLELLHRASWSCLFRSSPEMIPWISTLSREDLGTWGQGHKNCKLPVAVDSYVISSVYSNNCNRNKNLNLWKQAALTHLLAITGPIGTPPYNWTGRHRTPQVLPATLPGVILFSVLISCGGNMWVRTMAGKERQQELWTTSVSGIPRFLFWGSAF